MTVRITIAVAIVAVCSASPGLVGRQPQPTTREASAPAEVRVGIARPDGRYDVRTIPIEEYVAGVIGGEAARGSAPAALEALAIAIRTFAAANPGRHRAEGFDLCDQTHCQVLRASSAAGTRAAMATAGRILVYRNLPAPIFYTASCGGRTERPSQVWPGADDPDYLPSRRDDACDGEPEWTADLAAADLARALRAAGYRGSQLRGLRVVERNRSGRVTQLRLDGFAPDEISGQDLRTIVGRAIGWQFIKSTLFELHRIDGGYRFEGRGSGHGVGMCVIGSAKLAAQGASASAILARYFPGLAVTAGTSRRITETAAPPSPADDLVLTLPAADERDRRLIRNLIVSARRDLAAALEMPAPSRIALRFHPTVESYERAAQLPWVSMSAIVDGRIELAPLTILRDRGVLEKIVRRAIARVMVEPVFLHSPAWVTEGAAWYFAGERPLDVRGACPEDAELLRPVSPGSLGMASRRAAGCFARQMTSRRSWRDVR